MNYKCQLVGLRTTNKKLNVLTRRIAGLAIFSGTQPNLILQWCVDVCLWSKPIHLRNETKQFGNKLQNTAGIFFNRLR